MNKNLRRKFLEYIKTEKEKIDGITKASTVTECNEMLLQKMRDKKSVLSGIDFHVRVMDHFILKCIQHFLWSF
jgi:hypothetical protein